ncbi:hypothetical protein [Variovorax sp. JS1663]|uniref:hypothetical protein n=1 Tax=Variovorax sp. JS1663 TaxID=1851577 RepID=UPI000B34976F|nr:hypothetical protein [Variovorax sp. JS1663]OUL99173.1 hypothetical protein A8M77_27590 [Variovorax sp. JS1663]
MAYAGYREPGLGGMAVRAAGRADTFHVLDVTVACADARRVREAVARCPLAGVVRCEPLLHGCSSQEDDAPRVRLMVRLPLSSYAAVLHGLIETVPSGEIGRLIGWREHLARCVSRHGR